MGMWFGKWVRWRDGWMDGRTNRFGVKEEELDRIG